MAIAWEDVLKLVLALVLGGAIGAEREVHEKSAGLRTMIFISVGAALFTILSRRLSPTGDPGRIAAQIVTGVGFLGAGAILHQRNQVKGLTTAATVWLVAAIGMAVGADQYGLALVVAAIAVVVLAAMPRFEKAITKGHFRTMYEVTFGPRPELVDELRAEIADRRMRIVSERVNKNAGTIECHWMLSGLPAAHRAVIEVLLAHDEVLKVRM